MKELYQRGDAEIYVIQELTAKGRKKVKKGAARELEVKENDWDRDGELTRDTAQNKVASERDGGGTRLTGSAIRPKSPNMAREVLARPFPAIGLFLLLSVFRFHSRLSFFASFVHVRVAYISSSSPLR